MLALKITEAEIKDFMNKLLREPVFDSFEVRGVEIASFTRFEISGILDKASKAEEPEASQNYCTWQTLRPYILSIVKGGGKPKSMKIIFSPSQAKTDSIHPNASALFLNLLYEGDSLLLTAASSQKNFSMDKSLDAAWEETVLNFLSDNKITAVSAI